LRLTVILLDRHLIPTANLAPYFQVTIRPGNPGRGHHLRWVRSQKSGVRSQLQLHRARALLPGL